MTSPTASGEPDGRRQADLTDGLTEARHASSRSAQELIGAAVLYLAAASSDRPVLDRLAAVHAARELLVEAEIDLGLDARGRAHSWQEVGDATGRKKQSAQEYWQKAERRRAQAAESGAAEPSGSASPVTSAPERRRKSKVTAEDVTFRWPGLRWPSVTLQVERRRQ